MRMQLVGVLIGLGIAGCGWLVWDYVGYLRRQIQALQAQVKELEGRNDELVLALDDRAEVERIDEAIRKGHL